MTPTRRTLEVAIAQASGRGESVPCRRAYADLWTSASKPERNAAARRCEGCPVLGLCRDYAEVRGERVGVWRGIDRTPSPSPTNRRRKRHGGDS
ncbi:WhiB family transcriptional regulator [Nocardioides sp. NPDC004968]|uniref:WhiB family transcriptional regulator n=1 Tax=Nocardioides sp. NPDC004968 TaxID=3155894 RepID=UPI0033A4377C